MGGWGLCKKDLNEISPSGEPRKTLKKGEKVDGKEGSVKNKITINPEVQVENALINKIKNDFNIIQKAKNAVNNYNKKLQQNNDEINKVLPGTATLSNNSYEPEGEMVEDAKMGRMSDDDLAAAHKKISGMDQSMPSNQHMLKRINKEINKRKKANPKPEIMEGRRGGGTSGQNMRNPNDDVSIGKRYTQDGKMGIELETPDEQISKRQQAKKDAKKSPEQLKRERQMRLMMKGKFKTNRRSRQ